MGQVAWLDAAGAALTGRNLDDVCAIDRGSLPLGKGSFGTVWRAQLRGDKGGDVAVKAVNKWLLKQKRIPLSRVLSEVELMRECNGRKHIVQLIDFLDTGPMYYLILEFCNGGTLESVAKECKDFIGENQAVQLIGQMLQAINYLHRQEICHRDVKPENAMIVWDQGPLKEDQLTGACMATFRQSRSSVGRAQVKLGDFGLAVRLRQGKFLNDKVGSPAFMAPEMHLLPKKSSGYDHKVDVWALGIVMVFLLSHEYPFVDASGRLIRQHLLSGELRLWETDVLHSLMRRAQEVVGMRAKRPSKAALDLARRLLMPRSTHRLTTKEALEHSWFKLQGPEADGTDFDSHMPLHLQKEYTLMHLATGDEEFIDDFMYRNTKAEASVIEQTISPQTAVSFGCCKCADRGSRRAGSIRQDNDQK